jgi:hypothetical protein
MKIGMRKSVTRTALAVGLFSTVMAGMAHAQENGAGRLDGTWDIALTVRNCATGDGLFTVRELATFSRGGTMVSSTAALAPATKTPGHGVWSHVTGQTYAYSFKFFRFDSAGAFAGWTVIRQQAVLDADGNQYSAAGGAEVYSTAGTLVATGCSTTAAARFQ